MAYTIVNVAFPFAPVKADTSGGAEQVVLSIERALAQKNENSIVIAHELSIVNSLLIRVDSVQGIISEEKKNEVYSKVKKIIEELVLSTKVDLIHFHGLDFCEYIPEVEVRILATLHLPLSLYNTDKLCNSNIPFNCVSEWQDQQCSGFTNKLAYISNGISIPNALNRKKKPSFAFSLGRICPEKGYHFAIAAAKKADVPFILAGDVFNYAEHLKYYENIIKPALDSVNYRFIGRIGPLQKNYLYDNARCVLIPSLIEETSSLVAMEAMAHGVPVIAFRKGALSTIVVDKVNGFLVNDMYEMTEAIKCADSISAEVCYSMAREKFDERQMTENYLKMYIKIINQQRV